MSLILCDRRWWYEPFASPNVRIGSNSAVTIMQTITLYDQDFYAWTQRQIELLQAQQREQVDLENLVDKETPLGSDQLPQSCPFSEVEIFEEPIELEP
jgi:hypothetical protein